MILSHARRHDPPAAPTSTRNRATFRRYTRDHLGDASRRPPLRVPIGGAGCKTHQIASTAARRMLRENPSARRTVSARTEMRGNGSAERRNRARERATSSTPTGGLVSRGRRHAARQQKPPKASAENPSVAALPLVAPSTPIEMNSSGAAPRRIAPPARASTSLARSANRHDLVRARPACLRRRPGATAGNRRDGDVRVRHGGPNRRQRRQRHHGIAQPVRRTNDKASRTDSLNAFFGIVRRLRSSRSTRLGTCL